jgi:sulfatase modifying factor 1
MAALALAQGSFAQSEVSFEWVTVGDPGNPNDPVSSIYDPFLSGIDQPLPTRGAVPYVYSISKYETTIGQYTAFLNAVAKSDPHGLYSSGGDLVARLGTDGNYVYYIEGGTSANLPIILGYGQAARFVNWLHNGQGNGSTETGAYTISEGGQITRSPDARYWIPTENEWYKAAYYDPSPAGPADDYWLFPWRSDSTVGPRQANYYNGTYAATGSWTRTSMQARSSTACACF